MVWGIMVLSVFLFLATNASSFFKKMICFFFNMNFLERKRALFGSEEKEKL